MVAIFPGEVGGDSAFEFFVVVVVAGDEVGAVVEAEVALAEEGISEADFAEDAQ